MQLRILGFGLLQDGGGVFPSPITRINHHVPIARHSNKAPLRAIISHLNQQSEEKVLRSGAAESRFSIQFPAILGRDLSGEVAETGRNVQGFPKGMRVMALANGTYAEYTVAKADVLAPIPDALNFEQAGALPLVTTTGGQLIERAVKPKAGQTVLVTGALGGVGRTAAHVARKHGARVLAGVRAKEKEEASKLNADGVVAIDSEEEIGDVHDLDAIADTVGGTTIQRLLKTIRNGGVLGSVLGQPEGADKYDIHVEAFMAQPDASRLHQLAEDVARHEFSIPIARTMKLQDIQEAHRIFERGGISGKIVLVL
jgi:NADPH:quinone reductase-like Zn-dependent oxidoreductase